MNQTNVPFDILYLILLYSDLAAFGKMVLLNKAFLKFLNSSFLNSTLSNEFWKNKLESHFPEEYEFNQSLYKSNEIIDYKNLFKSIYQRAYSTLDERGRNLFKAVRGKDIEQFRKLNIQPNELFLKDGSAHCLLEVMQQSNSQSIHNRVFLNIIMKSSHDLRMWINDAPVLYWAVFFKQHPQQLHALISRGADVNQLSGFDGHTALHLATATGNLQAMHVLIERGANVNLRVGKNEEAPLHIAAKQAHLEAVDLLLNHGAEVDIKSQNNDTPLMFSLQFNRLHIFKRFIEEGAATDVQNKNLDTPLHLASQEGMLEAAIILLAKKANINQKNISKNTPFHNAVIKEHNDIAQLFLESDKNVYREGGSWAYEYAIGYGDIPLVKILIKNDIDKKYNLAEAVHLAVEQSDIELVKIIYEHGYKSDNTVIEKPLHVLIDSYISNEQKKIKLEKTQTAYNLLKKIIPARESFALSLFLPDIAAIEKYQNKLNDLLAIIHYVLAQGEIVDNTCLKLAHENNMLKKLLNSHLLKQSFKKEISEVIKKTDEAKSVKDKVTFIYKWYGSQSLIENTSKLRFFGYQNNASLCAKEIAKMEIFDISSYKQCLKKYHLDKLESDTYLKMVEEYSLDLFKSASRN